MLKISHIKSRKFILEDLIIGLIQEDLGEFDFALISRPNTKLLFGDEFDEERFKTEDVFYYDNKKIISLEFIRDTMAIFFYKDGIYLMVANPRTLLTVDMRENLEQFGTVLETCQRVRDRKLQGIELKGICTRWTEIVYPDISKGCNNTNYYRGCVVRGFASDKLGNRRKRSEFSNEGDLTRKDYIDTIKDIEYMFSIFEVNKYSIDPITRTFFHYLQFAVDISYVELITKAKSTMNDVSSIVRDEIRNKKRAITNKNINLIREGV